MKAIVTTGRKHSEAAINLAIHTAAKTGIAYVPRNGSSLQFLRQETQADYVLVAKQGQLKLATPAGEFFFHPNLAQLRLKNLLLGKEDHLVAAMCLEEGMSVLDCTLGLGADAIVASFAVGESGKVTAIESEPLIEAVVSYGLAHYLACNYHLHRSMRSIETKCAEALAYLREQPDNSFDVVYFDPMFRHPLTESKSLDPLRGIANPSPLSLETITEAKRVARRRVVLKENRLSTEFRRLGFTTVTGGRYSKIAYRVFPIV